MKDPSPDPGRRQWRIQTVKAVSTVTSVKQPFPMMTIYILTRSPSMELMDINITVMNAMLCILRMNT